MEMGGWTRLLIAGLMAGPVSDARAEGPMPAAASACHFEAAGAGKVSAIIDGRSFVLDDGREVRLAGIEVPFPPAPGETGPRAAAGSAARAALDSILAGHSIELRQRAPAFDRYGRTLAHVYVANEGRGRSVAHEMLATGYARVAAQVGDRACAAELLARERAARQAKLGLWGEPYYAIVGAESGAALLAERGQFTVVEGKVLSVRESGGTIYMNFGRRWSEALTVTVPKRQERAFSAVGLAPRALESRRVRVRGWVEERNGPRIEAASPEQIEIADRN
jgi:endonuclease YncB( thermonuclease family)